MIINNKFKIIHLMPIGKFYGRDGRGPYCIKDIAHAKKIISTTINYQNGSDIRVDIEHQNLRVPTYISPKPAIGWVSPDTLFVNQKGIWGGVQWTSEGESLTESKGYRYVSPEFLTENDKDGYVTRISGISLTHTPNLQLEQISSQVNQMSINGNINDKNATDTTEKAKNIFGISQEDDNSFLYVCESLQKLIQYVAEKMGMKGDSNALDVIKALRDKATDNPTVFASQDTSDDITSIASRFFPYRTELEVTLASQLAEERRKRDMADIVDKVTQAMREGKVTPGMKNWAIQLASQNSTAFDDFLKLGGVGLGYLFRPQSTPGHFSTSKGNSSPISVSQQEICRDMGLSESDYIKAMQGNE